MQYGIVQNKTYKNIDYLKYIPDEHKIDFIIGLFDGDGSVSIGESKNKSINLAVSKCCTDSMVKVLGKYGITCRVVNRYSIDVIYLSNKESRDLFKKLYINKYKEYGTMQRKYSIMLNI